MLVIRKGLPLVLALLVGIGAGVLIGGDRPPAGEPWDTIAALERAYRSQDLDALTGLMSVADPGNGVSGGTMDEAARDAGRLMDTHGNRDFRFESVTVTPHEISSSYLAVRATASADGPRPRGVLEFWLVRAADGWAVSV